MLGKKKTRELANRGISLEELLAFYKNLGGHSNAVLPAISSHHH